MADEVDMINRDPNSMNVHVQVMFDDVIGEPEGAHSADWYSSFFKLNYMKSNQQLYELSFFEVFGCGRKVASTLA
jgi:hypothetical protein